jgi:hypothetical protein
MTYETAKLIVAHPNGQTDSVVVEAATLIIRAGPGRNHLAHLNACNAIQDVFAGFLRRGKSTKETLH